MQCTKCGTTDADDWVTHKTSNIVENKSSTLHTVRQLLEYFCLEIADGREEDEEEED